MDFQLNTSSQVDEALRDKDNSWSICSLFLGSVDLAVKLAFFKQTAVFKRYVESSFSSCVPPYFIHSKVSRFEDKHFGTELG